MHVREDVGVEVFRQILVPALADSELEIGHRISPRFLMYVGYSLIIWEKSLPLIFACFNTPVALYTICTTDC
jgi:hypothetical protein